MPFLFSHATQDMSPRVDPEFMGQCTSENVGVPGIVVEATSKRSTYARSTDGLRLPLPHRHRAGQSGQADEARAEPDRTHGPRALRFLSGNGSRWSPMRPKARDGERQGFRAFAWGPSAPTAPGIPLSAERKGWPVDRIETRLTRDAEEGKIASIDLELLLGGDLTDEQRQRLSEIASRCPIHRTFAEGVTIARH